MGRRRGGTPPRPLPSSGQPLKPRPVPPCRFSRTVPPVMPPAVVVDLAPIPSNIQIFDVPRTELVVNATTGGTPAAANRPERASMSSSVELLIAANKAIVDAAWSCNATAAQESAVNVATPPGPGLRPPSVAERPIPFPTQTAAAPFLETGGDSLLHEPSRAAASRPGAPETPIMGAPPSVGVEGEALMVSNGIGSGDSVNIIPSGNVGGSSDGRVRSKKRSFRYSDLQLHLLPVPLPPRPTNLVAPAAGGAAGAAATVRRLLKTPDDVAAAEDGRIALEVVSSVAAKRGMSAPWSSRVVQTIVERVPELTGHKGPVLIAPAMPHGSKQPHPHPHRSSRPPRLPLGSLGPFPELPPLLPQNPSTAPPQASCHRQTPSPTPRLADSTLTPRLAEPPSATHPAEPPSSQFLPLPPLTPRLVVPSTTPRPVERSSTPRRAEQQSTPRTLPLGSSPLPLQLFNTPRSPMTPRADQDALPPREVPVLPPPLPVLPISSPPPVLPESSPLRVLKDESSPPNKRQKPSPLDTLQLGPPVPRAEQVELLPPRTLQFDMSPPRTLQFDKSPPRPLQVKSPRPPMVPSTLPPLLLSSPIPAPPPTQSHCSLLPPVPSLTQAPPLAQLRSSSSEVSEAGLPSPEKSPWTPFGSGSSSGSNSLGGSAIITGSRARGGSRPRLARSLPLPTASRDGSSGRVVKAREAAAVRHEKGDRSPYAGSSHCGRDRDRGEGGGFVGVNGGGGSGRSCRGYGGESHDFLSVEEGPNGLVSAADAAEMIKVAWAVAAAAVDHPVGVDVQATAHPLAVAWRPQSFSALRDEGHDSIGGTGSHRDFLIESVGQNNQDPTATVDQRWWQPEWEPRVVLPPRVVGPPAATPAATAGGTRLNGLSHFEEMEGMYAAAATGRDPHMSRGVAFGGHAAAPAAMTGVSSTADEGQDRRGGGGSGEEGGSEGCLHAAADRKDGSPGGRGLDRSAGGKHVMPWGWNMM